MEKDTQAQAKTQGEQERDNDAHRPDGSSGTGHDSTAQKTARDQGPHSSEQASVKNDLGFDPDSPDLEDPQVDPQGPAKPPRDERQH
ncbi:hypothetical protein PF66_05952 [Pseudomonas asplenii]|uniref:Uncharacterized protein n=1 Tax=Pseudomonas asplenii TaxID=53407 RepID=A0A0M9GC82_9PSED|nr:DUF6021 family protein [Pseudomonas fuscovaginae]KPA87569.1 hypothetical protein PF66_05952 [Pseudomonas fuscovaginae]KPA94313.1 hypothetical protein PF70_05742 [Pseudomonas fuscovaginae]